MAALGAMMAEITHEIRNPLVSIGGFARRLARKVTDPMAGRYLDIILGEVSRLEGIVHDNLTYVKGATPSSPASRHDADRGDLGSTRKSCGSAISSSSGPFPGPSGPPDRPQQVKQAS